MQQATPRAPGRTKSLVIAGLLTAAILIAAGLLGWFAHPESCGATGSYSCMKAADWGTFLSGVFAPIAFIWLVAAVWIQSQELAEQREELRLTRLEFEENREVMKQQAEEARKQAEFIGMQTNILGRQEEERIIARKEGDFSELLRELMGLVTQHFVGASIIDGRAQGGANIGIRFRWEGIGQEMALIGFSEYLASDLTNQGLLPPYAPHPAIVDKVRAAGALGDQIINLAEQLGPIQQSAIARLEVRRMTANISALLEGRWPSRSSQ